MLGTYYTAKFEESMSNAHCAFSFVNSVDRNKYQIHIPLPPKIDPTVTMMQVEDKPDVTYSDVGGCKEQIEKLREVVETPLLHVRNAHFNCNIVSKYRSNSKFNF